MIMKIYDHNEDKYLDVKITAQHNLTGDAKLLMMRNHRNGCAVEFAAIRYSDGTYFTTADWHDQQPTNPKDIVNHRWVDRWGQEAVTINGLPGLFSSALKGVLTAAEAEHAWNLKPSAVRTSCLRGRFRAKDTRRTGRDWLVTVAGMERLYGPKPVTE